MYFSSKTRAYGLALNLAALATLFGGCPAAPGTVGPDGKPIEPPAQLDSIAPQKGSIYGGTNVVIKGVDFKADDQITVGGINCAPFKFISDSEIHCQTANHPAGAADVLVLRKGVEQDKLAGKFIYGCVDTGTSGLTVWANDGGDKVSRDELRGKCDPESVKNPVWKDGKSISLFGAKNEVVNFNLVIEAATQAAAGVSVKFDTLTGPGGALIRSVPATGDGVFNWTDRNIELFYIRFLQIKGLSRISYATDDERQVPKRFQRPWVGTGVGQGGWTDRPDHDKYYPDIAVPMESVPTFDIASGQNQSVWSDIYIPKTAATGVYTGTLSVMQGTTHLKDVQVSLNVRGFELADKPASKTMVYAGYLDLAKRYLGVTYTDHTTGPQLDQIRDRIFKVAHRHKISLVDQDFGPDVWTQDNPHPVWLPRLNGSLFTPATGYDGPGVSTGNNVYAIGVYNTWNWSQGTQQDMWDHTNGWEQWFKANAPDTEHFLFVSDEPAELIDTQKYAGWMKSNPGIGSQLRSFTAAPLQKVVADTGGAPSIDIVASLLSVGDPASWDAALKKLRTRPNSGFYCYNGKRPASGSFATEDDGVSLRELAWGQYKKSIDRWFYWESSYYTNQQGATGPTNVFENAKTFGGAPETSAIYGQTSTGSPYGNGDGVLFYPGTDKLFPADSYGLNGPIVSLRLKQWRRGIQDVDYLAKARAINSAAVDAIVNKMVPKAMWEVGVDNPADPTYVHAPISWSTDPADWEDAREQLAHIIDGSTN